MNNDSLLQPARVPSWWQFAIALGLIPLGVFLYFTGLALGLGVGSSLTPEDNWIMPIALVLFFGGLPLAAAGALWFIVLLYFCFHPRRRLAR